MAQSRFHKTITQLTRSNVEQKKDLKSYDLQVFPVLVTFWFRFPIKIAVLALPFTQIFDWYC